MKHAAYIVCGGLFTGLVTYTTGRLILSRMRCPLNRAEQVFFSFMIGAASLSTAVFALSVLHLAYTGVFLAVGIALIGLAVRFTEAQAPCETSPLPNSCRIALALTLVSFGSWYAIAALLPEVSPDGATYHMGFVSEYYQAHRLIPITTSIYASFPGAVEMLFLFAFSIGKHSAASLVHLSFLFCLVAGLIGFGVRFGYPYGATLASILVFASPVAAKDATVAYVDVATAASVFAAVYAAMLWCETGHRRLLACAGLLSGFAFASKYTGITAVIFCIGTVIFSARSHRFEGAVILAAAALAIAGPWLLKNWIVVGNPVSPFLNRVFPNKYVDSGFEVEYTRMLRHPNNVSYSEIPIELTVRGGRLTGLIGPAFLFAPLALGAALVPLGRKVLLAAGLMLIAYSGNLGARFVIPALPFIGLAMGIALERWRWPALVLALVQAFTCWPQVVPSYCDQYAWGLDSPLDYRSALRLRPEEDFLKDSLGSSYEMGKLLDTVVPADEPVFSLGPFQRAYHHHSIIVAYESAFGNRVSDTLWTAMYLGMQPRWRQLRRFQPVSTKAIRLKPAKDSMDNAWAITELRFYNNGKGLQRSRDWRISARPSYWDIGSAFDSNPVTRWSTRGPYQRDTFVQVEFGDLQHLDSLALESGGEPVRIPVNIETMTSDGAWAAIESRGEIEDFIVCPGDLRPIASSVLLSRGMKWLLISGHEQGAKDFALNSAAWGVRRRALLGEYSLYEVAGSR